MASLSLKNVSKKYKHGHSIINEFNLDVDDNELIVILGPSGSGKTTLLRLISGLEDITTGQIYIADKLVNDMLPKDRNISMVFQNHSLYTHMSIFDNMATSLMQQKLKKNVVKQRVMEIAKTLSLENILNLKPINLSEGQIQKVAIAKAMVRNPKIFLLDEPLSALDSQVRFQLRNEILRIQQSLQTTMIYVTHDQRDAMAIASRIVILKDGYIQQIDTPQELYDKPLNCFVAGFIGYPPMNFFNAHLRQISDRIGISINNTYISLPQEKKNKLANLKVLDRTFTFGIRAENMKLVDLAQNQQNEVFEGIVEQIERTGSESYVKVLVSGFSLYIKSHPDIRLAPGMPVGVLLNLNKLHIFDSDTGKVITN